MTAFELPYVDAQRDRQGNVRYWYFRRAGRRWKLPGEPLTDEFMAEYRRLIDETEPAAPVTRQANPPGSFGALVKQYLASPEFREKKPSTQKEYRRVLEALADKHGTKPVRLLERRHIRQWRDARAETPGAANTLVRMVKLLMSFAVEHDYRRDNPAGRLTLFKVGEWRAWTDEECEAFETRWPAGTMERRSYALAVYTGQRRGDLVAMTRAHRRMREEGPEIRVLQEKTAQGADDFLWIPELPDLTEELAAGDQGHMSLLTTTKGKGFDPVYFGSWFAEAIDRAGLPDDCVLHGLRKTAARRLADAGCDDRDIMAITGHRTTAMVSHYTKGADRRRRATAAIHKLRNSK